MSEPTISTFSVTKGGKIPDTYACFQHWDLDASLDDNLGRFQQNNPILAPTSAWLKEMRRIFHVRFGDIETHRPLIRLAKAGMPQDQWAPILFWHLCMRELLVSDFLETWLYARKTEGLLRVRGENVKGYLGGLKERGLLDKDWTPNTISRMAGGLPSYVADFCLLEGKTVKEIVPFHPPDEALLYVLYAMKADTPNGDKILNDIRWRRFLLSRHELEQELLRLHQLNKLRFEVAGSLVSLDLPNQSVNEYVEQLVG